MNQTIFWSLAILGLFVWMLFRPYATAPWKILGAFGLLLVSGPAMIATLKIASHLYPVKYDYVLQSLDESLGLTAFRVARLFNDWQRTILIAVYELLGAAMVAWYGVHVVMRQEHSRRVLYSYLILYVAGAALYGVVPAMGPRYAFSATFPIGQPSSVAAPAALEGYPNAMPSLHMATALLFAFFNNRNRWLLGISCAFLAGTVCATLALEHYVIDLIVAVPLTCVAFELAQGRVMRAAKYLGVLLGWLLLIRFAWPTLLAHPWSLRVMAASTLVLGVHAILVHWRRATVEALPRLRSDWAEALT
jgi:PAP2 superfamily